MWNRYWIYKISVIWMFKQDLCNVNTIWHTNTNGGNFKTLLNEELSTINEGWKKNSVFFRYPTIMPSSARAHTHTHMQTQTQTHTNTHTNRHTHTHIRTYMKTQRETSTYRNRQVDYQQNLFIDMYVCDSNEKVLNLRGNWVTWESWRSEGLDCVLCRK